MSPLYIPPLVMPLPSGPASAGYLAWNFDPVIENGGAGMGAAGTQQVVQIPWPYTQTITTITISITSGGTVLTANQCLIGILNDAGTVLATSVNQATAWQSTGITDCALTSPTVIPAGTGTNPRIYASFYWNGTSQPQLKKANTSTPDSNGTVSAANKRFATTTQTGRTTSLGNVTMSGNTDGTASSFWVAVK